MAKDDIEVEVLQNNVDQMLASVRSLVTKAVYVGVPAKNAQRSNVSGSSINNAALAYIHNTGSERAGIPARPFMLPGVERVKDRIVQRLKVAASAAVQGQSDRLDSYFQALGQEVADSIKHVISEGIPPPIKPATVLARHRERGAKHIAEAEKAYIKMIQGGGPPSPAALMELVVPLINSAQLLNSISFVIKDKGK